MPSTLNPRLRVPWYPTIIPTYSGGLVDDIMRQADVQGDGLDFPQNSIGIWKASTNLFANGGAETNTTGWGTAGTNTLARSTLQAKFGLASFLVTYGNSTALLFRTITLGGAGQYTVSAWVYVPTNYDGTGLSVVQAFFTGATDDDVTHASVNMALRDQWQRVWTVLTVVGGDLTGDIYLSTAGFAAPTAGRTIYFDGLQIEAGGYPTPYIETDGSTANRTVGRIRIPVEERFTEEQGWVAFRVRTGHANTAQVPPINWTLFEWLDDGNNFMTLLYQPSTNSWYFQRAASGAGNVHLVADTFVVDDVITVIARWTGSHVALSVDGSAFTQTANTTIPTFAATLVDVGGGTLNGAWDGNIYWMVFGKGFLSDADAAAIHAAGNSAPSSFSTPSKATAVRQFSEAVAETFTHYNVYKRLGGESAWTRIKVDTDQGTGNVKHYDDYLVKPSTVYEYTVTVTSVVSSETVESAKQDPPESGIIRCEDFAYLHDIADPADYAQVFQFDAQVQLTQTSKFVRARGRAVPTGFFGEGQSHTISITGLEHAYKGRSRKGWDEIVALVTKQRTDGSVLCLRLGRARQMYFCQLSEQSNAQGQASYVPRIALQEVYYDEEV